MRMPQKTSRGAFPINFPPSSSRFASRASSPASTTWTRAGSRHVRRRRACLSWPVPASPAVVRRCISYSVESRSQTFRGGDRAALLRRRSAFFRSAVRPIRTSRDPSAPRSLPLPLPEISWSNSLRFQSSVLRGTWQRQTRPVRPGGHAAAMAMAGRSQPGHRSAPVEASSPPALASRQFLLPLELQRRRLRPAWPLRRASRQGRPTAAAPPRIASKALCAGERASKTPGPIATTHRHLCGRCSSRILSKKTNSRWMGASTRRIEPSILPRASGPAKDPRVPPLPTSAPGTGSTEARVPQQSWNLKTATTTLSGMRTRPQSPLHLLRDSSAHRRPSTFPPLPDLAHAAKPTFFPRARTAKRRSRRCGAWMHKWSSAQVQRVRPSSGWTTSDGPARRGPAMPRFHHRVRDPSPQARSIRGPLLLSPALARPLRFTPLPHPRLCRRRQNPLIFPPRSSRDLPPHRSCHPPLWSRIWQSPLPPLPCLSRSPPPPPSPGPLPSRRAPPPPRPPPTPRPNPASDVSTREPALESRRFACVCLQLRSCRASCPWCRLLSSACPRRGPRASPSCCPGH